MHDEVNHPEHYTSHPSGVECIDITEWYNFNIGNVIKYVWRHGLKSRSDEDELTAGLTDLKKAKFYLEREIAKIERISGRIEFSMEEALSDILEPEDEIRMDIIGQNGNTGEHYTATACPKCNKHTFTVSGSNYRCINCGYRAVIDG